jgi:hypothetical protein
MFNIVDVFPPTSQPADEPMQRGCARQGHGPLLQGGPPHHETIDPKISAPEGICSLQSLNAGIKLMFDIGIPIGPLFEG